MGPVENLEKFLGLSKTLGKDLDHSKKLEKALSPKKKVLDHDETTKEGLQTQWKPIEVLIGPTRIWEIAVGAARGWVMLCDMMRT